jgi:hypothetical protein
MSKTPQPPLEVVVPQAKLPLEQNQAEGMKDQVTPLPQLSKWRKLDPLRLQKIPPVPSERQVTREYGANILSRIFFGWMTPFMKVSREISKPRKSACLQNSLGGLSPTIGNQRYMDRQPGQSSGYLVGQACCGFQETNRTREQETSGAGSYRHPKT